MYGYHHCVKWCSWSILIIIHVLNSQFGGGCNAHPCFAVSCSYLTHRPSFSTGEESSQNGWRCTCMSANLFWDSVAGFYWSYSMSWIHNLAVTAMHNPVRLLLGSYLTQRPSFATGEKLSQNGWRSTCMSANLFLDSVACLYWSYSMSWIHNLAVTAMPTVLLLLVPISPRAHHLPLVRNWAQMGGEPHVWVPTYF
jgi:hypothetical protein